MTDTEERILLVDDEQAVLDALVRQNRKHFSLVMACGPEAGLKAITEDGPFAAVITDFQMPGMNGAQFLAEVRRIDSTIVRVMLTGQADLNTSIEAINRGHIFRFLTKPCDSVLFRDVLNAAIDQHRLIQAERLLLEQTVKGSIELLADVLSLTNPSAFGKATRARDLVKDVVAHLGLQDAWKYETAALLSQIGCVAVPNDLLDRMVAGETLSAGQIKMFRRHPELARDLLKRIPRLQDVAEMVYHQRGDTPRAEGESLVLAGGRILATVLDFDELIVIGASLEQAIGSLRAEGPKYDPRVLDAIEAARTAELDQSVVCIPLNRIRSGMVLDEDVTNDKGMLIVAKGHRLSESSLGRIRNYAELGYLSKCEFRVRDSIGMAVAERAPVV